MMTSSSLSKAGLGLAAPSNTTLHSSPPYSSLPLRSKSTAGRRDVRRNCLNLAGV